MFGKKRKIIEEKMKEVLAQIPGRRGKLESRLSSMEEREKSIHIDFEQVMENTEDLTIHAIHNVEEESKLLQKMDAYSKELKAAVEDYMQLKEMVMQHNEDVTNLVEHNKHYTTPSKYLTEVPATIRQTCQSYENRLEEMAESSRQMSVMAVNAAIEAGRMGDAGKQFVVVSESIRQKALDYEKTALDMKEELTDAQERIKELEDVIGRLISLMKDGNKGTNRLLKKSMELNKRVTNTTMRDFTEDVAEMRNQVVSVRNLEEEVSKLGERNQIQLNDIQEELQKQNKDITELESDLSHMFDEAEKNIS